MEATFQKVILTIAIIMLIVLLIYINMSLSNATASMAWPPVSTNCPDYWVDIGTKGPGSGCYNSQKIGTKQCNITTIDTMDFTSYIGSAGQCRKKRWATGCGVTWDGLTYGYGAKDPCALKLPS
jgi:hypothetical protein